MRCVLMRVCLYGLRVSRHGDLEFKAYGTKSLGLMLFFFVHLAADAEPVAG